MGRQVSVQRRCSRPSGAEDQLRQRGEWGLEGIEKNAVRPTCGSDAITNRISLSLLQSLRTFVDDPVEVSGHPRQLGTRGSPLFESKQQLNQIQQNERLDPPLGDVESSQARLGGNGRSAGHQSVSVSPRNGALQAGNGNGSHRNRPVLRHRFAPNPRRRARSTFDSCSREPSLRARRRMAIRSHVHSLRRPGSLGQRLLLPPRRASPDSAPEIAHVSSIGNQLILVPPSAAISRTTLGPGAAFRATRRHIS